MSHDYERHALDNIYDSVQTVADELRRIAASIERTLADAKENEGTTQPHRLTFRQLPERVTNTVLWGVANAQIDRPSRLLTDFDEAMRARRQIEAKPIADRMRAFSAAHKARTNVSDTIYEHIMMDGPDDARYEVHHVIDTDLLDTTANLLDPKGA